MIPKVLATNAGHDAQETMVKLQEEYAASGQPVGLDLATGKFFIMCFLDQVCFSP